MNNMSSKEMSYPINKCVSFLTVEFKMKYSVIVLYLFYYSYKEGSFCLPHSPSLVGPEVVIVVQKGSLNTVLLLSVGLQRGRATNKA